MMPKRRCRRAPGPCRLGQPRPGVGVAGEAEGHAMAEDGRAAPDRAERAQAHRMAERQRVEIGVDRLGAFHVHHPGDGAGGQGRRAGRAAVRQKRKAPSLARSIQCRCPAMASATGWAAACADQGGQGQVIGRLVHHRLEIGDVMRLGRGDVDGEEAAREAALLHAGQVEMALARRRSARSRRARRGRAAAAAGSRYGRRRRGAGAGMGGSCGGLAPNVPPGRSRATPFTAATAAAQPRFGQGRAMGGGDASTSAAMRGTRMRSGRRQAGRVRHSRIGRAQGPHPALRHPCGCIVVGQIAEEGTRQDQHRLGFHLGHAGADTGAGENLEIARAPVVPPDQAMAAQIVMPDSVVGDGEQRMVEPA